MVPIPITQEKATLFAAFLGAEGRAVSTIESYLAALRHYRLLAEPDSLCLTFHTPHMKLLLKGIKRTQSQTGSKTVRLPITSSLMRRIKESLQVNPGDYLNVVIWAACCIGFFGFLRCSEFLVPDDSQFDPSLHLTISDLHFQGLASQGVLYIHIKGSKTDQFRQGTVVALGSTGGDLCPVLAMLDYLARRGNYPGPVFMLADQQPLRRHRFVQEVQQALSTAGVQGTLFNGHSFRIGAATSANAAGVPETTIKLLGRWSSSAYQQYIRPSPQELAQVSKKLV